MTVSKQALGNRSSRTVAKQNNILHWIPDGLQESGDGDWSGRNSALMSAGGWMQKAGFDDQTIIDNVIAKNSTFSPPLDNAELKTLLGQILKLPKRARTYGLTTEQLAMYSRQYFLEYLDYMISKNIIKGFVIDDDEKEETRLVECLPLFMKLSENDDFEELLSDFGAEERHKKSNQILTEINSEWMDECFGKESK
jgi:hypothetical protein